jgi:hypothetical protein
MTMMMTLGFRSAGVATLAGTGLALFAPNALAADPPADASTSSSAPAAADAGALLLAGKLGRIAAALAAEYTAPSSDGSQTETFSPERVPDGGSYTWELRQKELVLQPTFFYRWTGLLQRLTPYTGIGPRFYFLESVTRGKSAGQSFSDTAERSTKIGFGVPLGAEFAMGPGGFFGELLPHWAPMKHTTTGDSHLGGMSLFVGYRAAL